MTQNILNKPGQDHGGDVYQPGNIPVLRDFSASINPLGHPDGVLEKLNEEWREVLHYPDRRSAKFLEAASRHYGLGVHKLMAGNGSAELIDLFMRALRPKRVILCPPDFGLYEKFIPPGTPIYRLPRLEEKGFAVDTHNLEALLSEGDLVLVSNPGNPSGAAFSRSEGVSLANAAKRAGAVLVVDEAFCDYCPDRSLLDLAGDDNKLLVLRSMTKFYGIPGVRLGFVVAHPDLIEAMELLRQPWSVSTVAQIVGEALFEDDNWGIKSRQYITRAKEKLVADLLSMPGMTPLPTEANYLLLRLDPPAPDADLLYARLREEGTLIRHCQSFGLGNRYVRLAIRTVGENADLIRHIKGFYR